MSVKLLTKHHLEFLSLKGGCTGSSESTLVKIPHCWKSCVAAQFNNIETRSMSPISNNFFSSYHCCICASLSREAILISRMIDQLFGLTSDSF